MIYVQEKDFEGQLKFLGYISNQETYLLCAWLYPESRASTIAAQPTEKSSLEPITSYGNGHTSRHTSLTDCTKELLQLLSSSQPEIVANCDSIALYKSGASTWSVAVVGHEGVCLVRDEALLTKLIAAGFCATLEAPSWW